MTRPQLTLFRTDRLRNARTLSDRIEIAIVRIPFAKTTGKAFGKMWRITMCQFEEPIIFPRSTNIRSLRLST